MMTITDKKGNKVLTLDDKGNEDFDEQYFLDKKKKTKDEDETSKSKVLSKD